MSASGWVQWRHMTVEGLRNEFASPEKILSPILFALTTILILNFAFGSLPSSLSMTISIAETFITMFLALQVSFSRAFEADEQDRLFDLFRSSPISPAAWFLSKFAQVAVLGATVVIPTIGMTAIIGPGYSGSALGALALSSLLALLGLSAVGVLLASILLRSSAKSLIFPLLYFPLTVPVLLASIECSRAIAQGGNWSGDASTWLGLLGGFDVIYFVLGLLLFDEVINA